eukprot:COSAG06_NODE_39982_length_406_cov_2.732899_1_plen_46_part_01
MGCGGGVLREAGREEDARGVEPQRGSGGMGGRRGGRDRGHHEHLAV